MIIVLINETVKKYLLKQSRDTRNKIRDKFEFLESGLWEGGLKVKKLKGVSAKYILEARLDRGNRALFTLGRDQTRENNLIIYVWGIVVHDDIAARSKTIIPANAPFLQFEDYQETFLENVDMEELEPAYFTQESITERCADESGSQRWYAVGEPEWQRIRMYSRDDFDLFLHLTPEQDELLGAPLPQVISGTAGSGKTSLAVYYLLNRNLNDKKKLFLTYNKHLKNFAVKLYNGLLNERTWKKEVTPPDFYTFKELCLEAAGKERFPPGKEVDFNRFNRLFTGYPNYQSYDAALVWEEIRAIIKGAAPGVNLPAEKEQNGNERTYLSFAEYEMLGKKKAPNFRFNRGDIYRIFEWYQNKLHTGGLWDELDMMPGAVDPKYTYDILVCDEVQDLTDTQLDLLFHFVKNPRNIFLAGDTRQTINPSGFRWEEVRTHFYERGVEVPELKTLSLNFRSSGSIIELSNTLLDLKEKFTGRKADETREQWKYKGRPVTVVTGIDTAGMLEILKAAGPAHAILVRTDTEKESLKNILRTELVFTIQEAKGLEFDTVVLWKFCDDPSSGVEDVWKATLDLSDKNIHEARIKHEISLLYVGITRCREDLIVYDGNTPSLIWDNRPVKDNVYITGDRHYLENVWNVISSPAEWVEQGNYFFERGYFKAAAECFKNGGDSQNMARANAHYYEEAGNYPEAAANFAGAGEIEKAAVNYELAGAYNNALELWEKLNRQDKMTVCTAVLLEAEGKFQEAGNLYLSIENYNAAVDCFKKAGNDRTAAEIYLNHLNSIELAARHYEYAHDYEKAADLYTRLEMLDKAAELYFQGKKYDVAEALWEKTGSAKNLLELYRRTGRHEKLFTIYELEDDMDSALKYLETLKRDNLELMAEGEELFQNRRYFQALIRFLAVEGAEGKAASALRAKIADCYYKRGEYKNAITYYANSGDFYSAARVCNEIKDYETAFCMYFDSPLDKAKGFVKARKALKKIADKGFLRKTALGYYFKKDYERAMFLFKRLKRGFEPLEGICYTLAGNKKKALKRWQRCRYYGDLILIAEECLQKELIAVGAEFFLDIHFWEYANRSGTFKTALGGSSIEDLMKAYFGEQVKYGRKKTDWNCLIAHKEDARIWAYLLLAFDEYYRNACSVQFYLELNGDYNALLKYFLEMLETYPKYSREILEAVSKNSPAHGVAIEEAKIFQVILKAKVGPLDGNDLRILELYPPKIVLKNNNFLLLGLAPVAEEYRNKVNLWCKKNGYKGQLKTYLQRWPLEKTIKR